MRLEPTRWHVQAGAWLAKVDWDATYDLEDLRLDVEAGKKHLFDVLDDNAERVGVVAVMVQGDDMVIVAAAGEPHGLNQYEPLIHALARRVGTPFIRFHTSRLGMARHAERMGFELAEVIYRKRVNEKLPPH